MAEQHTSDCECIDYDRLGQLDDEELALQFEEQKQAVRESSNTIQKALLNDEPPLTDAPVREFSDVVHLLHLLRDEVATRVPQERRRYD